MGSEPILARQALKALKVKSGVSGQFDLEPLSGGRNNRVFRVRAEGRDLLLKVYFHDSRDPRNRLKQEFEFLRYLWSNEIQAAPEPIGVDHEHHVGLYEFVHGRKLKIEEIQPQHIEQAVTFFHSINRAKGTCRALCLPIASEACFSLNAHLEIVEKRVERLQRMKIACDADKEAQVFLRSELLPLWKVVRGRVAQEFDQKGLLHQDLPCASRCLSPSDFGYHNALLEGSGRIRFLDFEYAGWDDPAKLVCDFANQPDMLLPDALSRSFQGAVVAVDKAPELLAERIMWLTPVYQVKWSCIILNDFLPEGRDRARFVGGMDGGERSRKAQLEKSQRMLKRAEAALEEACRL